MLARSQLFRVTAVSPRAGQGFWGTYVDRRHFTDADRVMLVFAIWLDSRILYEEKVFNYLTHREHMIASTFVRLVDRLPASIRRRITTRFIENSSMKSGLKIALYDPRLDILRFPEAREGVSLLKAGIIADAVPWMLKINNYIPEGGVVFDVGGFRGITSQWFSRVASQVFTFEPMPESADSIRLVLKIRAIKNVSVHEIALSEKTGTSDFHIYKSKGHNSLGRVDTSQYIKTIQVPTTSLDEFASEHQIDRIDFLKIDVEGFELEVLKGASRLLASKKIGAILFEANRPVLESIGKTAAPIYNLLRSHSYHVTDLDGRSVDALEVNQCRFGDFLARPS